MVSFFHRVSGVSFALLAFTSLYVQTGSAQAIPLVPSAVPMGENAPDSIVTGTAWLRLHNQAAFDTAVAGMYIAGSANYHHFAQSADVDAYAPTAAELNAVKQQLTAHKLLIIGTSAHNLGVQFTGKSSDFEAAFQTTVQRYGLPDGTVVRRFSRTPALDGSAAGLIQAVSGVGGGGMKSELATPFDPATGKQLGVESLDAAAAEISSSTASGTSTVPYCLYAPHGVLLHSTGAIIPDAAYAGLVYAAPASGGQLVTAQECSYTPAQFFSMTGLDTIHARGFTGAGQTIAILEENGSPTLMTDVAGFDSLYGLPAANLMIHSMGTLTPTADSEHETTLDVEWAHAVAPDANILVVNVPTGELVEGLSYVVENGLANAVTISYGSTERSDNLDNINAWNEMCELAASQGISVQASSGDYGDRVADERALDVNVPADSPYATAVGGVSIAYAPGTTQLMQTGWGHNFTQIGTSGVPLDPPVPVPQVKFGSGGGVSTIFAKPAYQVGLAGTGRHLPDVSAIADPYTGLKIVITDPTNTNCTSQPCVELEGGTSLASPVFTGELILLNQRNGGTLGQAAPLVAEYAGSPAITDVLPPSANDVQGAILDASGIKSYSAQQLALPQTAQPFVSVLWQTLNGTDFILAFGTDSSLQIGPGWDPVTGWGTVNMSWIFAQPASSGQNP